MSERSVYWFISTATTMLRPLGCEYNLPRERICDIVTYRHGCDGFVSLLTNSSYAIVLTNADDQCFQGTL